MRAAVHCGAGTSAPPRAVTVDADPELPPARRPKCPRDFCARDAIAEGLPCAHHRDLERPEPTAEEIDTLVAWGWRATADGWWRDPSSGGRWHWRQALVCVRRDAERGDLP